MIRVRCPICQRLMQGQGPAEWPQFPFCSQRCRLIDLGRWLGEQYTYRLDAEEDEEEASAEEGNSDSPP